MPLKIQAILLQTIVFVLLAIMLFVAWSCTMQINYQFNRIEFAHKQQMCLLSISNAFQTMHEQTAELFIFGKAKIEDIKQAQKITDRKIEELRRLTASEDKYLDDTPEQIEEQEEAERTEEFIAILESFKTAVKEILLDLENNPEKARQTFLQKIQGKYIVRIKRLTRIAIRDEIAEVDKTRLKIRQSITFNSTLLILIIFTCTTVIFVTGRYFKNKLVSPLEEVSNGFEKIANGHFQLQPNRVSYPTEISILIENYNNLAEKFEQKHVEHKTLESKLSTQIEQKTKELTKTNKKLKHLDTVRAQFLADISHELRTPLTAIRGETEIRLRRDGHDEDEYRATLARVKVLSDQMAVLVDDLMFLARSEKDAIQFDFKTSDLEGIMSSVVNNFRVLAKEQNIEFQIDWPEEPLEILMDVFRLRQAFGVILDNALKYSFPSTKILIAIIAEKETAEVVVNNQGQQISPDELPYVFERFYRGEQNQNRTGSGLGLPIAKWIVEKHQGSIKIASDDNGVTTTTIILPRIQHPQEN